MGTQYAVVVNDMVVNVVLWDGEEPYTPSNGQEFVELTDEVFAGIGWMRVDGVWGPVDDGIDNLVENAP